MSNFLSNCGTEFGDGTDEDLGEDENFNRKASKKKEKKRQEREAQRQVHLYRVIRMYHTSLHLLTINYISFRSGIYNAFKSTISGLTVFT